MRASTLVLFDWDDTLFPTSSCTEDGLIRNGGLRGWSIDQIKPNFDEDKYSKIGHLMYSILSHFIDAYGASNVNIVTNGSDHWVQVSLRHLSQIVGGRRNVFQDILHLLQKHDITIISAQHRWAHKVTNISEWKYNAFNDIIDTKLNWNNCAYLKFITIGDRDTDHDSIAKCIQNNAFQKKVRRYNVYIEHERYKMIQKASLSQFEQQMLLFSNKLPQANEYMTTRYHRHKVQLLQNNNEYFTKTYHRNHQSIN